MQPPTHSPDPDLKEPAPEVLAARPRGQTWDPIERVWQWRDEDRRRWTQRPDAFAVVAAALAKGIPAEVLARLLRTSVPTIDKVGAGRMPLPITLQGIAHGLHAIAEITTEL